MNLVVLSGNLVADPETREVNGTTVANVRLASTRKFTLKNGTKREDTIFIDCAIWGALASTEKTILFKGDKVLIQGRLEQQTWEKDGEKRSKFSIRVENFEKQYHHFDYTQKFQNLERLPGLEYSRYHSIHHYWE